MQVRDLKLSGLKVITPRLFQDERGFFFESYSEKLYLKLGVSFVQDNVSFSRQGTIRALHFQSDPGQDKLISCLSGKIWDVAVDIRPHSPTYMQWEAIFLDDQTHDQFFIPKGFAHGFCVLSPSALVQYKVSNPYNPNTERSIRWNDPSFKIAWPVTNPILSMRDQISPFYEEIQGVVDFRC
ncbi:MAG: dTDP-4-dehydrorhamnose 3,5-epimerase [Chlamydiae bacterium CG10_big_fil_rev_8_21_14_0_10_42_34]|nr:MAG: dTDP-4-dehydrorhamnose 3,5-epimerase [Chlamydiae bacterium CG10_big_fil_rev_8_21_14_0_10_42_34]